MSIERKLGIVNVCRRDVVGYVDPAVTEAWTPTMQYGQDILSQFCDAAQWEIVPCETIAEAIEKTKLIHFITNDPAETPLGLVQGAAGWHSVWQEFNRWFAVSLTQISGRPVAMRNLQETIYHENFEGTGNGPVTEETTVFTPASIEQRWGELVDPTTGQGQWANKDGIVPLDGDVNNPDEPDPDPCAGSIALAAGDDPTLMFMADAVTTNYTDSYNAGHKEARTMFRQMLPERYAAGGLPTDPNVLETLPNHVFGGSGFMARRKITNNVLGPLEFIVNATAGARVEATGKAHVEHLGDGQCAVSANTFMLHLAPPKLRTPYARVAREIGERGHGCNITPYQVMHECDAQGRPTPAVRVS